MWKPADRRAGGPAGRRAELYELYAEGLKRIAGSGENDYRRYLLAECLEAYADLDEAQKERFKRYCRPRHIARSSPSCRPLTNAARPMRFARSNPS